MALRAREHGRPHAAADVAKDLLSLAGIPLRRAPAPGRETNGASTASTRMRVPKEVS
jgi:hypothetical protein